MKPKADPLSMASGAITTIGVVLLFYTFIAHGAGPLAAISDWGTRPGEPRSKAGLVPLFLAIFFLALGRTLWGKAARDLSAPKLYAEADALAEEAKKTDLSLQEVITALLDEAAKRQSALLVQSERRLNTLYKAGLSLMVSAVLVPFFQVSLYLRTDTVHLVSQLTKLGLDSKDIATLASPDWHLLLVGATFGLLFLAAARSILLAEEKQRSAYFRLAESVTYYGDLSRFLRIFVKVASSPDDIARGPAAKIMEHLLAKANARVGLPDGNRDESKAEPIPIHDPDVMNALE
jgi:hypothetical protein